MKCIRCALLTQYCICSELIPLSCRPKISIIRHYKESYKTSNSARIIDLCIQDSEIFDYGIKNKPLPELDLDGAVLLFPPDEDLRYNSPVPPKKIIIVDGTWKQATRSKKSERTTISTTTSHRIDHDVAIFENLIFRVGCQQWKPASRLLLYTIQ